MKRFSSAGFTLIELLVVIGIIGVLASLAVPQLQTAMDRAKSITCMGNLRQIGVMVTTYANEHDGEFPYIEPDESDPVYPEDMQSLDPKPIYERLLPYGITKQTLKCPNDRPGNITTAQSYFDAEGSSYQWAPILDGETTINPQILGRRGMRKARLSRVRICMDYEAVHFNRMNRLYADGHATAVTTTQ